MKMSNMAQWPPSPFVEDEVISLAHEHSTTSSCRSLKSEDQPAESRGSVDQYPIIIDSPILERAEKTETKQTKRDKPLTDSGSSDDSAGPPTPPPLFRKPTRSSTVNYGGPPVQDFNPTPTAPPERQPSTRGRPQVTRIQTDIAGDVRAMARGDRRPPSPYSYTRTPTSRDIGHGYPVATETFLSPSHANTSPLPLDPRQRPTPMMAPHTPHRSETLPAAHNIPTIQHSYSNNQLRPERPTKNMSQGSQSDSQQRMGPQTPRSAARVENRRSYHGTYDQNNIDFTRLSPSNSRRPSKDMSYGSSSDERISKYSPPSPRRPTVVARDSPYSSSTEESSHEHRRRGERSSGDDEKRMRRRSSHRRERPIFVDIGKAAHPESASGSAIDGSERRHYRYEPRESSHVKPITPVTGDASKAAMEDYFEKAFRENDSRRSQRGYGPRSSGSSLVSPMTSPPRTPRSEQQSKNYFDHTPTAQRPSQQSRPPSMDEAQIRDLKSHSTLLSAATAGAAMAARTPGSSSRSSGQSTDTMSSVTTSKPASAPRSRRPSPVSERIEYNPKMFSSTIGEPTSFARGPPTSGYDQRPISRGSVNGPDTGYPPQSAPPPPQSRQVHALPHRTVSYSGPDHMQPWSGSHPASAVSPTSNSAMYSPGPPPQPRSARPSITIADVPGFASVNDGFPVCPRSQPTVGYRDWYTIKEMSQVDICPTCMSTAGNSRYRDLFVPSLPRPYNEPSVCVMSKPWVRVAFQQSLRQNRPDLSLIEAAITPPKTAKPCTGSKPDVKCWYQAEDFQTREAIPNFYACPACIAIIDQMFPDVCDVFSRPKPRLSQERTCSLSTTSKHFQSIVSQLDSASMRTRSRAGNRLRTADVEPLLCHLRNVARFRPCPKDEMLMSRSWHYMPDLPEFTVCEECYNEFIWPIADWPIARDISKVLKAVPSRRGSDGNSSISCQLSSERMRKLFRDAIEYRNLAPLRESVRTRVAAQQRLTEMNKLYEKDLQAGIDRRSELERNHNIWQGFR